MSSVGVTASSRHRECQSEEPIHLSCLGCFARRAAVSSVSMRPAALSTFATRRLLVTSSTVILPALPKAEKRKNDHDHDDQANEIDNTVHNNLLRPATLPIARKS